MPLRPLELLILLGLLLVTILIHAGCAKSVGSCLATRHYTWTDHFSHTTHSREICVEKWCPPGYVHKAADKGWSIGTPTPARCVKPEPSGAD